MKLTDGTAAKLSFGSERELHALGKLTLIFSMVDESLADYAATLAAVIASGIFDPEAVMGDVKSRIQKLEFSKKIRLVRRAIETVAGRFAVTTTVNREELWRLLQVLSSLAQHRHDLVHGWLSWDPKNARPVFRNKDAARAARAEDIEQLNNQLFQFELDFHKKFIAWILELQKNVEFQKGGADTQSPK